MKEDNSNFETIAIHGGTVEKNPKNSLNYPVFMTSTFSFDNLDHAEYTFTNDTEDYVYTRGNNPTLRVLERKMALLEGGEDGVAFASGMAAISSTLFSLVKPGDRIIAHNVLYGSSYNVLKNILPEYGVDVRFTDLTDPGNLKEIINHKTRAIYFETPANPNLDIIDIAEISRQAEGYNTRVVIDNTFATPYFQNPLSLGADIVVHSATKYISGHGDVVGGIAVASDKDYIDRLKFGYMCEFGGVMSPFNGWLLLRGLKTLAIRMKEHEKNARKVAGFLKEHPGVKKVYYPGLGDFKGHQLASQQMSGYGAIISFEVEGSTDDARKLVDSFSLIKLAVSLGDAETLAEYPFAMTHRDYSPEDLAEMGLTTSMIRLSIGLENHADIIADLEQALED